MRCVYCGKETGDEFDEHEECLEAAAQEAVDEEAGVVLGHCPHGVDLDREFCQHGCRV